MIIGVAAVFSAVCVFGGRFIFFGLPAEVYAKETGTEWRLGFVPSSYASSEMMLASCAILKKFEIRYPHFSVI